MMERDWCDDADERDAVRRAEQATRFGWAAIAGTVGAVGCVGIGVILVCAVAVVGCLALVVASS
ncbi:hypothetical protein AB0C52_00015 [Streptomyces sp. NPDC048717]|uniref:hypothetical protein n=1 Tax=Streptomyces sp. NPDC048717 TaxID=3154928 RepID=UPI00343C4568